MNAIRQSSQDQAHRQIKEWTLDSRFKLGQRLNAGELALELQMSRTPVREALARLEQEGLIRRDRGWGYVVNELKMGDVTNLYRVRRVLEVEAATEALPQMSPDALEALERLLDRCASLAKQNRISDFLRHSRRFYQLIAKQSDNPILEQMLSIINDRVLLIGGMLIRQYHSRSGEILKENAAVLDALRSGDAERVAASVRNHVSQGYKRSVQLLLGNRSGVELGPL